MARPHPVRRVPRPTLLGDETPAAPAQTRFARGAIGVYNEDMTNTDTSTETEPRETWELNFTPTDAEADEYTHPGTAMLYRYVRGGICGPFTGHEPAADLIDAEALGLKFGLQRTGEWELASNGYWHAPAAPIA